jgi:hypothetical protein
MASPTRRSWLTLFLCASSVGAMAGCAAGGFDDPATSDGDDVERETDSISCGATSTYHGSFERCGNVSGAFTASSVNIGYYPAVALRDTDVFSGDYGPGLGGRILRTLKKGEGFAIQSTRNPTCADAPPMRPAVTGMVYGQTRVGSESGWISFADLFIDYAHDTNCADGPRLPGTDFEVSANPHDACRAFTCDLGHHTCVSANGEKDGADDCVGGRVVDWKREVDADTLHLRYAQGSTSIGYLHRNDRVNVLFVKEPWAFVEITRSAAPALTPVGTRAWTMVAYLRVPTKDAPPSTSPPPSTPPSTPPPESSPPPPPASDPRYCCAKCSHREAYHRVDVSSGCADAARAYCTHNDRGTFQDAMWGVCAP